MRTLFASCFSLLLLLTSLSAPTASAQDALTDDPGYVDMDTVSDWFDQDASLQVDIREPLLDLIAASSDENGDFASVVRNLRAIQVRGYAMQSANLDRVDARADELAQRLEQQGWTRAMFVRNDRSVSRVYLRRAANGDDVHGLTVFTTRPDGESIFVNIVGPMTPDQIHRLGEGLDIESLRRTGVDTRSGSNSE